ncbi:hypothetical protein V7O66_01865 [Methanolobus sp. ZRKC3]|uniref:hypothetical protein n=1 Tax=Methanolobus sp. ZRKC3 TaxID=3125786 RepID=UPI003244BD1D
MISKSFEIKDYMIDGTHINGFWMTLDDREKLTTEVVYAPASGENFDTAETESIINEITTKCDSFKSLLPENVDCEVIFKDLNDLTYTSGEDASNFELEPKELDEIRVVYSFYVKYYI